MDLFTDPPGALIDGEYRYWLRRGLCMNGRTLVMVMLNPSTADHTTDDPTIRRCIGFGREMNYGTLLVLNLFALRATNPAELRNHPNPVGPNNDAHMDRDREMLRLVAGEGFDLHCLANPTKNGLPRHPLYLPKHTELQRYGGRPG